MIESFDIPRLLSNTYACTVGKSSTGSGDSQLSVTSIPSLMIGLQFSHVWNTLYMLIRGQSIKINYVSILKNMNGKIICPTRYMSYNKLLSVNTPTNRCILINTYTLHIYRISKILKLCISIAHAALSTLSIHPV